MEGLSGLYGYIHKYRTATALFFDTTVDVDWQGAHLAVTPQGIHYELCINEIVLQLQTHQIVGDTPEDFRKRCFFLFIPQFTIEKVKD